MITVPQELSDRAARVQKDINFYDNLGSAFNLNETSKATLAALRKEASEIADELLGLRNDIQ